MTHMLPIVASHFMSLTVNLVVLSDGILWDVSFAHAHEHDVLVDC